MNHAELSEARDFGKRGISPRLLQLTALGALVTLSYVLGAHRGANVSATQAVPAEPTAERAPPPTPDVTREGPSALAQRDDVVAGLRASGPDERGLTQAAATVLASWKAKVAELGVDGDWGHAECYAKGCFVTAAHPSDHAASQATDVITRTGEFNGWQAGKMRSGVIPRPDGTVEVTWVLYAPAPDHDALLAQLPPDTLEELRHAWVHPAK